MTPSVGTGKEDAATPVRVLIAEDQPDVSEALRLLLKGAGYSTEWANSPPRVLEALSRTSFDAVLVDLNYTRDTTSAEEGIELIRRLHELDKTLPMIAMTAWGSIEIAVEAMRRGAGDFVQKPWDNARLLHTLEKQIEIGREARKESDRLKRERAEHEEAREIQQSLLPKSLPEFDGMEMAADWLPTRVVAGDYYDVVKFSASRAAICVADVSGKGLPAALLVSSVQATVRAFAHETVAAGALCARVNSILCSNHLEGRFVTFFFAMVDRETGTLSYCNAGHNAPVLVRRDGSVVRLREGGPVLGEFPEVPFDQESVAFGAGDRLLIFTDGVSEARGEGDVEFGEPRLEQLLVESRGESALELRRRILSAVHEFRDRPLEDDATMLIVAGR
ncbi:MAG TPA: SpoIIE family protein phosphatase [Candidatus Acidoferrales bacterium]|nr:SpoIIE family protein phosphatase [Candidatus Acidoferrales bacterium]